MHTISLSERLNQYIFKMTKLLRVFVVDMYIAYHDIGAIEEVIFFKAKYMTVFKLENSYHLRP